MGGWLRAGLWGTSPNTASCRERPSSKVGAVEPLEERRVQMLLVPGGMAHAQSREGGLTDQFRRGERCLDPPFRTEAGVNLPDILPGTFGGIEGACVH